MKKGLVIIALILGFLMAVIMPLFWIAVVYSLNKMNYFSKIVKE